MADTKVTGAQSTPAFIERDWMFSQTRIKVRLYLS